MLRSQIIMITWILAVLGCSASELFQMEAHKSPETEAQRILETFVNSIGKDPKQYNLFIVKKNSLNAHAGFNNQITINSDLIETVNSEPGLALVIAHELGHLEKKHVVKSVTRNTVGTIANIAVAVATKGSALGGLINDAEQLTRNAFSRSQEHDADIFAINLVNQFYCKEPGKLVFFETVSSTENNFLNISYFRTHPITKTRIKYMTEMIQQAGCVI
ncbi:MAG: M48 family metallopeptidase [Candidatus Caenarcaniphilales bacterium]|jgi:predicted Zn-dependent protease|nr:M48 family metallopeptidase [Candidatus Caenarcaniphilales bacterium]